MVKLMLQCFGGDHRKKAARTHASPDGVECYHVNARISRNLEDVGGVRFGKLVLLLVHCAHAIWCRFRYDATTLYYVPAPGKSFALYRDWLVMGLCRPFFKRIVFHWHATSLAKWLETERSIRTRSLTYRLLGKADLSIVLSPFNRFNAEKMWPRRIEVVPNGIPDPCPNFETVALPRRKARLAARRKLVAGQPLSALERAATGDSPELVRVLFLAHCAREKGLFDAIGAVLLANEQLRAQNSPLSFQLIVTGIFPNAEEKREFDRLCQAATASSPANSNGPSSVAVRPSPLVYAGFVQAAQKHQALLEADLLCFPSHWENQPVSVIEALAYGLPIAISRLPSVIEMLPAGYKGVADIADVHQLAAALIQLLSYDDFSGLRQHFVSRFTLERFASNLAGVLRSVEQEERQLDSRAPTV